MNNIDRFRTNINKLINDINMSDNEHDYKDLFTKFLFRYMNKYDRFFDILLKIKKNKLNINNKIVLNDIIDYNSLTGKFVNDIAILNNINIIDLDIDDFNVLIVVESQSYIDYNLPIRLRLYCEYLNTYILNNYLNSDIHGTSLSLYKNVSGKLPIIIPVILNMDNKYKYIGDGEYIEKGVYRYNYYEDYTSIPYEVLDIDELRVNDFNWYQIDVKDCDLNGSILYIIHELIIEGNFDKGGILGMLKDRKLSEFEIDYRNMMNEFIEEGIEKGIEVGREEGIEISILTMFKNGMKIEDIAYFLNEDISYVKSIINKK